MSVTGLEATCVMLSQSLLLFYMCSEISREPESKSNRLSCLVKGIS